jgi:large subunit ribosomal protein L30
MEPERKLMITLKRSGIGRPQRQRATLRGLGLTKLHKTVVLKDTPETRGMVAKVIHLVDVKRA